MTNGYLISNRRSPVKRTVVIYFKMKRKRIREEEALRREVLEQKIVPAPRELPTCEFCGVQTIEWWSWDGKTNTCKCGQCARKGIYTEEDWSRSPGQGLGHPFTS